MTYTLTVEVGNNQLFPWAGYKVQLLAGETILAEDDDSLTVAEETFETSTVTYTYNPAHSALLGEKLQIRLFAKLGYIESGVYSEMNVDDVQLTVIPEPATMGLLGMGALALIRRKRK
jgi:hypothetical protein